MNKKNKEKTQLMSRFSKLDSQESILVITTVCVLTSILIFV